MSVHSHSSDRDRRHGPRPALASERRALRLALALTASFAVVEAGGGWWAGSLALLSDAGHMVTDVAALAVALFAQHLAERPPSRRASYGYARAEVLAAFINALLMLAVVGWIAVEAMRRLLSPAPVSGGIVVVVAAAGLAVNVLCAWMLSSGRSLNSRAALVHVLGDMAGSVAALVAGAVIATTGWVPIDP
jgi:cobalt-zinc-cadmium efflux system protein